MCDFCSSSGSAAEKSFNRVDVFKRHLISVHGVGQTFPNSRNKTAYNSTSVAGTCATCSITFADAREFYLHLDDCILRLIQRADPAEAINQELLPSISDDNDVKETLDRHLLPNEITGYTKNQDDDEEKNSHQPSQDDLLQQSKEDFSGHDAPKQLSETKEEPYPEITRCACGYGPDEGTSVQCDVCKTWQHLLCYYDNEEQIPQTHECVSCKPRPFDQARIKERQKIFKNITYMSEREPKPPGLKSPKKKQKDLGAAITPTNENASPASEGRDSSNYDSATQPPRDRESIHDLSDHAMPVLDLSNVEGIPFDHDS